MNTNIESNESLEDNRKDIQLFRTVEETVAEYYSRMNVSLKPKLKNTVVEDIYEKILDKRSSGQKRGDSYTSFVNWHFIFAITLIGVLLLYKF